MRNNKYTSLCLILIYILGLNNCSNKSDEEPKDDSNQLIFAIDLIESVNSSQIALDGLVTQSGQFREFGICWSTDPLPNVEDNILAVSLDGDEFSTLITELTPGTKYYFRAYATISGLANGGLLEYSEQKEFLHIPIGPTIVKQTSYTFGSNFYEYASSSIKTFDGGILVSGSFQARFSNTNSGVLLLKYNQELELQWKLELRDLEISEFVNQVIQDSEGNFLLVSTRYRPQPEPNLIKVSQSGNLVWQKRLFERVNNRSERYSATSIIETSDGNYTITGNWNPQSAAPAESNFALIKTTKEGDVLSIAQFGEANNNEIGTSLEESPSGELLLIGSAESDNDDTNMRITKFNPDGSTIWTKDFGGPRNEFPQASLQTSDGNLIIAGTSTFQGHDLQAWLIKIDWNGSIIWERTISNPGQTIQISGYSGISEDQSGNLLFSAMSSSSTYGIKLNSIGKFIWDTPFREFGGSNGTSSMFELDDGHIVLIGKKQDSEINSTEVSDVWLVKMKEEPFN